MEEESLEPKRPDNTESVRSLCTYGDSEAPREGTDPKAPSKPMKQLPSEPVGTF